MTHDRLNRRHLIGMGAASGLLSACTFPDDLGREDRSPIEGGIGGTGIVGLVTDFSSLIINGLKVETTQATRFTDATGRISPRTVGFGDVLTVEAVTRGNKLYARRVHVTHPLIGRVQAAAGAGSRLMVNGVMVKVEPQARDRARPGDRVRVSGLWMGPQVVASQIIPTNSPVDVMAGEVNRINGQINICTIPIDTGRFSSGIADGQFATVLGTFKGDSFDAKHVRPDRFTGAAGALKRLSVEGYLDETDTDPGFKVAGLGHSFADDLALDRFSSERAVYEGPYTGKFEAERGVILPPSYAERRALFEKRALGGDALDWSAIT